MSEQVDDGLDSALPAELPPTADLVVIGAGLAGAATAWAATRHGLSVVLLEQFALGHSRGSSHGSARIFRRAYADEMYVRLTGVAGELWSELENDAQRPLLRLTGGIDHGFDRKVDTIAALLGEQRIPHELLDAGEAGRRWPGMRFDGPVLFHPQAGVLDAASTVESCLDLARGRGAVVRDETPVRSLSVDDDHVDVHTDDAVVRARRVVVATGAWIGQLLGDELRRTGARMPGLEVTQQQVFHFPRRDPSVDWPIFVYKGELSTYGLPGGRDGGPGNAQKVAEHDGGSVTTADARDAEVNPAARARIVDYVERWLPGLEPTPFNETTCLYTTTVDEDFVIDRIGPVVICSACSGHGAKFAPWLGETATALAMGRDIGLPRFALDRAAAVR